MMKKRNAFTLVELLAVIVILAIILVIAVPKVMSIIKDAKKGTLETTAKMIASTAEKKKLENTILENNEEISCKSVAKLNDTDYPVCKITFDGNTAKVTITGGGQFEGLYVCNGTKTLATATEESCTLVTLTVDPDGGTETTYNAKYEAGSTVTLTEPTKEGFAFVSWVVETGEGAEVNGNTLKMGTTATKVKATWEEEQTSVTVVDFETDSWETIVAAVKQASDNGEPYPYEVGDEKEINLGTTLGIHTIRVANRTKCSELEQPVTSETACGFVLEFADIIAEAKMNSNPSTNVGGWPSTTMIKYLNETDENDDTDGVIYNALPEKLKDGIIETKVISSKGGNNDAGPLNGNYESTDKLYLLSPEEVWGTSFTDSYDSSRGTSRQLDYYATYEGEDSSGNEYIGVSTTNYGGAIKYKGSTASAWWLRSAFSDTSYSFYYVISSGRSDYSVAYISYGVAPAFRLGE